MLQVFFPIAIDAFILNPLIFKHYKTKYIFIFQEIYFSEMSNRLILIARHIIYGPVRCL